MSASVHVEEILVRAFRGVPEFVQLPLDAQLTLIEAPNGTGKSTICDAAEWILTGSIDRLKGTEEELRSRFSADSAKTEVKARIRIGDESFTLARSLNSPKWLCEKPGSNSRAFSRSELLELLAPTAADLSGRAASEVRSKWLKGNRFLASSSLSRLVDPDYAGDRKQLFADLLGMRHLLDGQKRMLDVARGLGHEMRLAERKLALVDESIAKVRVSLAADPSLSREAVSEEILRRLPHVEKRGELLGNLDEFIVRVSLDLGELRRELETRLEAGKLIDAEWQTLDNVREQRATIEKQIALLTEEQKAAGKEEAHLLCANRLLIAQERLEKALSSYQEFEAELDGIDLSELTIVGDSASAAHLDALVADQETIEQAREIVESSERAYLKAAKEAPDEKALESLLERREVTVRRRDELQQRFDLAVGPVRSLQESIKHVLADWQDETICPACRHDWEKSESLVVALSAATESLPPALMDLAQKKNDATFLAMEAENAWNSGLNLRRLAENLRNEVSRVKQVWQEHADRLQNVGVDPSVEDLGIALRRARSRIKAAESREILQERLSESAEVLVEFLGTEVHYDEPGALLLAIEEALAEFLADQAKLARVQARLRVIRQRLQSAETERQAHVLRLANFDDGWKRFAKEARPYDERGSIQSELRQELDRLEEQEGDLAALRDLRRLQVELEAQDTLRRHLEELIDERRVVASRVAGLKERHAALVRIASRFDERQSTWASEQLAELLSVVSPLYCRAQVNEVVHGIRSDNQVDPFQWLAIIGNSEPLSPDAHFSQGQRQDLALALFLARARGLGGTFFLDEPASHLDDLNRVALLDILRVLTAERGTDVSLVVTTASRSLVRHLVEKLSSVRSRNGRPVLRVISLSGNPRLGVVHHERVFGLCGRGGSLDLR